MAKAMAAEPLWRAAFERYEKLGLIPEGRRAGRPELRIDAWPPPLHSTSPATTRPTR